jgi:hypothetical protein
MMNELPTTIDAIADYITDHGCWNREGYATQQRQAELAQLAQLVHYLVPNKARFRRFLEIGSAAGGTARILDDFLGFDSIHIIDDNALDLQDIRKKNLPNAVEWIGDSTTWQCVSCLKQWGVAFDLIHIDAGHTYQCVSADMTLAKIFAVTGAVIFLHDVLCCDGVKQLTDEICDYDEPQHGGLKYITTFGDDLGIGVFRWM